jgi:signal transduction histidine kinase
MLLVGATRYPEAAGRVGRAVDQLDGTIKDIRSTIFSLQTRDGTRDGGLRARVLAVVEESADTMGIRPTLRMDGLLDTRVPERQADQLLAALREALANVAKHARASRMEVAVSVNGGLLLRVRDDGVGIPRKGRRWTAQSSKASSGASGGAVDRSRRGWRHGSGVARSPLHALLTTAASRQVLRRE